MIVDFFMKPLQGSKFRKFCDLIMNIQEYISFRPPPARNT